MTYYTWMDSPIGPLLLLSNEKSLTGLWMGENNVKSEWVEDGSVEPLAATRKQLSEYFEGTRKDFDLPLEPRGTEFQKRVWDELKRIPYGQIISYGELAKRIGNPNAMRAVGLANGRNPISIIVPCHRVIGANGSLTGYGGGLPNKKILLELETGASLFAGAEL